MLSLMIYAGYEGTLKRPLQKISSPANAGYVFFFFFGNVATFISRMNHQETHTYMDTFSEI